MFFFFFYVFFFFFFFFFFSSRRRHTRWTGDWSSDVCSSDLWQLSRLKTVIAVDGWVSGRRACPVILTWPVAAWATLKTYIRRESFSRAERKLPSCASYRARLVSRTRRGGSGALARKYPSRPTIVRAASWSFHRERIRTDWPA